MNLSPQQKAVIDFGKKGTGSLNLIACAGTGKTTTLLELVSHLQGSVWFCAFNKAIVQEIEFKAKSRGLDTEGTVRISTVHSAGMRTWNQHIRPAKCKVEGRKIRYLIEDEAEHNELFVKKGNIIGKLVDYAKSAGFGILHRVNSHSNWEDLIDHYGMDLESDGDGPGTDWYSIISAAIVIYNKSLKQCQQRIDFSDMLLAPLINQAKFPQYDNILIDEAQDISPLRLKLILSCLKPNGRVIAVGDPNQAIYGFTGADDKSMETIKDHTGAKELPLTVTYRCPKVVVQLAQTWVPRITAHESAPDGKYTTVNLKEDPTGRVQGLTFWDCAPFTNNDAILCRNTKPLVELAYQFLRKQLPCRIEGRDIGEGLIRLAEKWKSIGTLNDLAIKLEEYKVHEVAKLENMKQEYKAEALADQVDTLQVLIEAAQDQGGTQVQDVSNLIRRLFGDTPEGEQPKCTVLSTVHKSKGREWPRVFLLGRNKYMPSKWARQQWEKDQENNLMYVAVTRTQAELIEVNVPGK